MKDRASKGIAAELRRMLVTGELAPGTVVSEADLCDMLGCGRTPLREALQQLSQHYLVALPPRSGVLIPELTTLDFQQAHEAMLEKDSMLAELAAERVNEEPLMTMKQIIDQQIRADEEGDSYELAMLDYRLHTLIAQATGNKYFIDSVSRLHGAVARFVYRSFQAAGSAKLSIEEHQHIVEALEQRDPDLAREKVREHSIASSERALSILGLPHRRGSETNS